MKIYGYPTSYSTCKVLWALAELSLPYELAVVDVVGGEQKQPHITRLNPNQGIPILEEDGFVLYESGAILSYLEAVHGKGKLLPADQKARSLVAQWLFWENGQLGCNMVKPWLLKFGQSLGAPFDEAAHAALVEATRRPLAILNDQLAGKRFLVGDALSLADIALGEAVHMHGFGDIPIAAYPHIVAWYEGLTARAAFAHPGRTLTKGA